MSGTVRPTQPANHNFTPLFEAKNGLDKTTFFGGCEYVPRQSPRPSLTTPLSYTLGVASWHSLR